MFIRCQLKSDNKDHDKAPIDINLDGVDSIGPFEGGGSIIHMMLMVEDAQVYYHVHQSYDVLHRALTNNGLMVQP